MGIRHKEQIDGSISIPGSTFTVGKNGALSPDPTEKESGYLLQFPDMFEKTTEAPKPEHKRTAPKAVKPVPKVDKKSGK